MIRATVAAAFLLGIGGLACSGDDEPTVPPECDVETLPAPLQFDDSGLVGFVRVTDFHNLVPESDGTPRDMRSGRIQAGFGDFRAATATAAQLLLLGPVCVGVTSRSQSGGRIPLSAGRLTVDAGGGSIAVTETSTGGYVYSGGTVLTSAVSIQAEGADFPAFMTMVDNPPPLDNLTFEPEEVSPDGMLVRWTAGGAKRIRLTIAPPEGSSNSGGQVICEVVDDGCFALPAAASSFVLSNNELEYNVTAERINDEAETLSMTPSTVIRSEAVQRRQLILKSGVFE